MRRLKSCFLTLLLFLALCLPATAVLIRTTATPEVDHLVMQGCRVTTSTGSIIQYMLVGFQATDRGMEARIAWHVLRKATVNLSFAFSEFTITTDKNKYSAIGIPGGFSAEDNEAGSFSLVFSQELSVTKLGTFSIQESAPEGSHGLVITNCRVLRSNIND
jgi:hypothetical protein